MIGAMSAMLAAAVVGVQFGWQPLDSGGNEYIVQVEPELVSTVAERGFTSDVPPDLRDVRRIRIIFGTAPLPHQGEMVLKGGGKPTVAAIAAQTPPAKTPLDQKPPGDLPAGLPAQPLANHPAAAAETHSVAIATQTEPVGEKTPAAAPPERHAAFIDDHAAAASASPPPSTVAPSAPHRSPSDAAPAAERETPWLPLIAALGGLVVSLAANFYLGWVHWETRRRYQAVVGELRGLR